MAVFDTVQTAFAGEDNESTRSAGNLGISHGSQTCDQSVVQSVPLGDVVAGTCSRAPQGFKPASGHTSHTMHPLDASA